MIAEKKSKSKNCFIRRDSFSNEAISTLEVAIYFEQKCPFVKALSHTKTHQGKLNYYTGQKGTF